MHLSQMDTDKHRLLGCYKRGKAKQITRTKDFLKRQGEFYWVPCVLNSQNPIPDDIYWLEIHIWHVKRAKMQTVGTSTCTSCASFPRALVEILLGCDPYRKGCLIVAPRINARC